MTTKNRFRPATDDVDQVLDILGLCRRRDQDDGRSLRSANRSFIDVIEARNALEVRNCRFEPLLDLVSPRSIIARLREINRHRLTAAILSGAIDEY